MPNYGYDNSTLVNRFVHYNLQVPTPEADTIDKIREASGNLFFRALSNVTTPHSDHYQDSSVVLINRNRHAEYLKVITQLLPTFHAGYGDKELFWVSASIAHVPYAFSPYLAGGLANENTGACILHYDPNDEYIHDKDYIKNQPLYINAEDNIERVSYVGQHYQPSCSKKVKVDFNMPLKPIHMLGLSVLKAHGSRAAPDEVTDMFLRAQWVKLNRMRREDFANFTNSSDVMKAVTRKLGDRPYTCIPIRTNLLAHLSDVIQKYIVDKGVCQELGCPLSLPLIKTANNTVFYRPRKTEITCVEVGH